MPPLVELQSQLRSAVTGGDVPDLASLLSGLGAPDSRLAIHRRHYETSLVNALLQKFPAIAWLVGTPLLTEAARRFARAHPPTAPCIAEYGESFPEFLSTMPETAEFPYIGSFGELEWHIGQIAVAIDRPALTLSDLVSIESDLLPDLALRLQLGLRYLRSNWLVDELMKLFLSDSAPCSFALNHAECRMELRGSRGTFSFSRLRTDDFAFRSAISAGATIAQAAQSAVQINATFDLTVAFSKLFSEGLVTSVATVEEPTP